MAGSGTRFSKYKVSTPKPLIKYNNLYLFMHASKSMPDCDLWIFIIRRDFDINSNLTNYISSKFKKYKIIYLDNISDGQAHSCYFCKKYLLDDDIVTISSCDLSFKFNQITYFEKINSQKNIIFISKPSEYILKNSNLYSWFTLKKNNKFHISLKESPNSNISKVIIGAFGYYNKRQLISSIEYLIDNNIKLNDEYYLDSTFNILNKMNNKIDFIEVTEYFSFGSYDEVKQKEGFTFD